MSTNDEQHELSLSDYDTLSSALVTPIEDVFEVQSIRQQPLDGGIGWRIAQAGAILQLTGRLLVSSEEAYRAISQRFRERGYLALLRESKDGEVVIALPGTVPGANTQVALALGLFLLTLISVLYIGGVQASPYGEIVDQLLSGWPYAASLLGILLSHEFGHYLVGRRLGVPSSLPYFIPMPLSILGTLGAVIRMNAPPKNRRALLAMGAAGPLAGFLVALPILIVGLKMSTVMTIPQGVPYVQEGNSLLYAGIKVLIFGRFLPAGGTDVFLHPVAMAGWTGLMITGLNLIPAGQLDGGHIAYALLGERARWLIWGIIAVLLGLSMLWQGWLLWVALVFLFGRVHAVPLDDVTRLRKAEYVAAVAVFIVLALVFTPIPLVE